MSQTPVDSRSAVAAVRRRGAAGSTSILVLAVLLPLLSVAALLLVHPRTAGRPDVPPDADDAHRRDPDLPLGAPGCARGGADHVQPTTWPARSGSGSARRPRTPTSRRAG